MFGRRNSLILEIQEDIARQRIDVVAVLRKALIASKKLNLTNLSAWMDRELKGYFDCKEEDVPEYRTVGAQPRFFNPYRGWCPIILQSQELRDLFMRIPVRQPIGEIDRLAKTAETIHATYSAAMENFLREQMDMQFEIRAHISTASVSGISDAVNNTILEWTLELEKSNIFGDGMSFSDQEKREAVAVTQHIYAQNVGNVGNVSDQAKVTNKQTATINLSVGSVAETLQQIDSALALVPEPQRAAIRTELNSIQAEIDQVGVTPTANHRFSTIRSICEQIAGNVGAAGIIALIARLLGGGS
jgi:hypothetical protein